MKKILLSIAFCFAILIGLLVAHFNFANDVEWLHFQYFKNDNIIVIKRSKFNEIRITNENFEFILDWSDDYSRESYGTAIKLKDKILFSGALNHSREILFVYHLNGELEVFDNVIKWGVDKNLKYWFVQGGPLFSDIKDCSIFEEHRELTTFSQAGENDIE